jgi:(p)ppGpp synthase/HD superfamily hydrolase
MMRQYELVERVQRYKPDVNEGLLNKAYVYAMQKHGHQRRASGDPYFSHPLEVAAILTDMHMDEATIAVALLHDTIEDTTATRQEIDELFGADLGKLVEGLTKLKKLVEQIGFHHLRTEEFGESVTYSRDAFLEKVRSRPNTSLRSMRDADFQRRYKALEATIAGQEKCTEESSSTLLAAWK